MKTKTIYFVGKYPKNYTTNKKYKGECIVEGIFTNKQLAIKNCLTKDYFVMPIPLNAPTSLKQLPVPELYIPKLNMYRKFGMWRSLDNKHAFIKNKWVPIKD